MDQESFSQSVRHRFRAPATRTIFANTTSRDAIAISKIVSPPVWTIRPPPELGFTIHVQTGPLTRGEMFIDGRPAGLSPQHPGYVRLLDLAASPYAHIQDPIDFLRINITQRTLDDLAYDRGGSRVGGLRTVLGTHDAVLYGLACALESHFDMWGPQDQLFIDHVALAFHSHIVKAYGEVRSRVPGRGGLAPWQSRLACERMVANMDGAVGIAELASACGLSVSYFARAFRQTFGKPPHRWLMGERIKRAKRLLRSNGLTLPEVAFACGFSDQSHFTRVFLRTEGATPGRWRQSQRG